MEEQFFAVLVRLRTATSVKEMARHRSKSTASFSKLFTTWVNFLAYELLALHEVPSRKPRVLIKAFLKFSHTRMVIDCTEVFSQRPSGLHARKQFFSKYKHHNTSKFLVGISPSGSVTYVSNMWGGRASDKKIPLECGLLDKIKPGLEIMADRGFTVEAELREKGISLRTPSFLGSDRAPLMARK